MGVSVTRGGYWSANGKRMGVEGRRSGEGGKLSKSPHPDLQGTSTPTKGNRKRFRPQVNSILKQILERNIKYSPHLMSVANLTVKSKGSKRAELSLHAQTAGARTVVQHLQFPNSFSFTCSWKLM